MSNPSNAFSKHLEAAEDVLAFATLHDDFETKPFKSNEFIVKSVFF